MAAGDGYVPPIAEHRVDIHDVPGHEAHVLGAAPPSTANRAPEQVAQRRTARQLERPLRNDAALRSILDMKGCPGIFLKQLLQPQLIRGI